MKNRSFLLLLFSVILFSCSKSSDPAPAPPAGMYYPPVNSSSWEKVSPQSLGWNNTKLQELKTYLASKNTKSFMILVNGRIVVEEYFNGHDVNAEWQWNSAGKTLTTAMISMAQQEGKLNINDKVSKYIGTGWTSAPLDKENLVTIKNLLSMTSGLNDEKEFVSKANLTYVADAGTRWSYHNVFQRLMDVTASASGQEFETYFNSKLKTKIGMDGFWNFGLIFNIYHSSTRGMARFGILALNKGRWNNEQVLDQTFFNECVSSSQNINPSYGYLWWLNGKSKYMVPGGQTVFQGPLVPNAPADMFAAMGAEDQRIYVIPSKNMVVVRMGDASDPANPSFAVSGFDNELWAKINSVIF